MNVARPLSIVLIEDNLADVYLIERSLRMHEIDFELVRFDNGDEALRYLCPPLELSLERPDLILLDLHLPGTEGPEILKAIGAESRLEGVPVAILTGAGFRRTIREDDYELWVRTAVSARPDGLAVKDLADLPR